VSHHAEPDHSGELADTIRIVQPDVVYASAKGQETLDRYYGIGEKITPIAGGESIDLGGLSLVFAETRMCHWPDSMESYLPERKILFSQDGFGMHLASSERFDDEIDPALIRFEAAKYYANILLPLSPFVQKTLDAVTALNLDIEMVAPDHGPIWRGNPTQGIEWYAEWAQQKRNEKVAILTDTMWGSTSLMARAIAEGVTAGGAKPTVMSLGSVHRSDVATRIMDAGALVVGSPTLNNNMLPRVADVMCYLKGLKPKGLVGATFGSFGWSGEAPKQLAEILTAMKVDQPADPVTCKYMPDAETYAQCFELGKTIAKEVLK
jgi:flavorubredoxin